MFHSLLFVYLLLYAYACIRTYRRVIDVRKTTARVCYAVLCALLCASFLLSRSAFALPSWLTKVNAYVGGYWFVFSLYLIMITAAFDAVVLVVYAVTRSRSGKVFDRIAGISILFACVFVTVIGSVMAQQIHLAEYDVSIDSASDMKRTYNIVVVSDIHVGEYLGVNGVEEMIKRINALNPDLVLLAGDIFDNTRLEIKNEPALARAFATLNARLGVFAVPGNHDVFDGGIRMERILQNTSIKVLRDESAIIDGAFVLIGRDDALIKTRAGIADLLKEGATELPAVVMDHQPSSADEAIQNGVALYIGGHTHGGQIFPFTLATRMLYPLHYGFRRSVQTHLIVSSGYGTWAAPVRLGSSCEIVRIRLIV